METQNSNQKKKKERNRKTPASFPPAEPASGGQRSDRGGLGGQDRF